MLGWTLARIISTHLTGSETEHRGIDLPKIVEFESGKTEIRTGLSGSQLIPSRH